MKVEILREVEDFIQSISDFETRRNGKLRKKIHFLRKFFGDWEEDHRLCAKDKKNPNPFFMTKEKFNA